MIVKIDIDFDPFQHYNKRYEHVSSLIIHNFRKHSDETEMI